VSKRSIKGRPRTSASGLGRSLTTARNRVPRPPAKIKASRLEVVLIGDAFGPCYIGWIPAVVYHPPEIDVAAG